eukprot:scaffold18301_cov79-Skeletonema_menzelii.AAC.4
MNVLTIEIDLTCLPLFSAYYIDIEGRRRPCARTIFWSSSRITWSQRFQNQKEKSPKEGERKEGRWWWATKSSLSHGQTSTWLFVRSSGARGAAGGAGRPPALRAKGPPHPPLLIERENECDDSTEYRNP